ncbi:hypothetical protein M3194_15020 [Paenibacillus glycanilyticus]|uniref:hypothetical protein n=1 Tax=Paenibacillus glycanilyticus TaxID=126569 RepID=UPI00203AD495|nr:hypothetical protein [Paenibacillus glycanilyticus]MCM3628673.1 hypothetical protein [Paenibacillus glycanilyticus]
MKFRRMISILLSAAFILSVIPTFYLIENNKNNTYISGLMFLTIVFFILALGNTAVYYTIKFREQKRR